MDVRNCRKCGKLFNYIAGPFICPSCRELMELKFQDVKKYIQQHGKATMTEVSKECDVDTSQIQKWIREERLQFSDDSPIKVSCEICGKMIGSGRFCLECKDDMTRKLNGAMGKTGIMSEPPKEQRKSNGSKMRYLDN